MRQRVQWIFAQVLLGVLLAADVTYAAPDRPLIVSVTSQLRPFVKRDHQRAFEAVLVQHGNGRKAQEWTVPLVRVVSSRPATPPLAQGRRIASILVERPRVRPEDFESAVKSGDSFELKAVRFRMDTVTKCVLSRPALPSGTHR